MLSVAYVSSITSRLSDVDFIKLMQLVRRKNPEIGVSGMLLYCAGEFMQVLEGPDDTVRDLYAKIRADPRHADVVTVLEEPIRERRFAEWTMGMRQLTPRELKRVSGWSDLRDATEHDDEANRDAVYDLLITFRRAMS